MRRPFCPSSLCALALLSLALPSLLARPGLLDSTAPPGLLAEPDAAPVPEDTCEPDAAGPRAVDPALIGIWHRYDALTEGDRMRFWFFHEGGFGLYRYGKVGLTNTHSFNYTAKDGVLDLQFRKTGEHHVLPYHLAQRDGHTWLTLDGDPREPGASYFHAPPAAACPDMSKNTGPEDHGATPLIGGRLWGEETKYVTGGMGFSIYQFQAQSIDGRGVGWHHRGDYDEWTTETLIFRQRGGRLALSFPLRHDGAETDITVIGAGKDRRLRLDDDPRDFWRPHTYRDMGPTFAGLPGAAACLPF